MVGVGGKTYILAFLETYEKRISGTLGKYYSGNRIFFKTVILLCIKVIPPLLAVVEGPDPDK